MEKIEGEKLGRYTFFDGNQMVDKFEAPLAIEQLAEKINEIIDWSKKFENLDSD